MATDQDYLDAYVASFLSRPVTSEKVRGVSSPDAEAAAVFESIALNLITRPRAVLYLAHLARNGLLKSITDEIAAVDEVVGLVRDFSNISISVKSTSALDQARVSLLQVEGQGKLVKDSAALGRFNDSVRSFLDELGKSVKGTGTSLLRPSQEAEGQLQSSYASLVRLHNETSDRLNALVVGVDNFFASDIGASLSLATVQTVRADIESLISAFSQDDSASGSRDAVYRLVAARAVLRMLSSPPAWDDPMSVTGSSTGGSLVTLDDSATIQPGDFLAGIEVLSVDGNTAELAGPIAPFTGTKTGEAGLVRMWNSLREGLQDALAAFLASDYASGLVSLDQALAGLTAASPAVQVGEALRTLTDLRATLVSVQELLGAARPRSVAAEKKVIDGILATLEERGYDRAVALLLRCKLVDAFQLDWQTASFAGNLMKSTAAVAQNDIRFPNKEQDEVTNFSTRTED